MDLNSRTPFRRIILDHDTESSINTGDMDLQSWSCQLGGSLEAHCPPPAHPQKNVDFRWEDCVNRIHGTAGHRRPFSGGVGRLRQKLRVATETVPFFSERESLSTPRTMNGRWFCQKMLYFKNGWEEAEKKAMQEDAKYMEQYRARVMDRIGCSAFFRLCVTIDEFLHLSFFLFPIILKQSLYISPCIIPAIQIFLIIFCQKYTKMDSGRA